VSNRKFRLDGPWRYEVETRYDGEEQPIFSQRSIGQVFASTYGLAIGETSKVNTGQESSAADATVIRIKALVNEMKYDLKTFTVKAGKPVKIIFENPDHMQHNLVITVPDAMEAVGRAADKLATANNGADLQYVPDIPEVLFHTRLANPRETVTLE